MSTKSKLNDNSRKTLELLTSGADALGIPLDASQLEQFRIYYETPTDWNSRVNLTSISAWPTKLPQGEYLICYARVYIRVYILSRIIVQVRFILLSPFSGWCYNPAGLYEV